MNHCRHIVMPDLGLDHIPLVAGAWLADQGSRVLQGERVVEILAGEVTVDLVAPASGILAKKCVQDDDPLEVGQLLGVIVTDQPADEAD